MTSRPRILLLGKTPPPYMGPSIATEILLKSELNNYFRLIHQETKLNSNLDNIGKMSVGKLMLLARRYLGFLWKLIIHRPQLVLIPISQSWSGFSKDAVFIRLASLFGRKIVIHLRGSNFLTFYNELPKAKQQSIRSTLGKCYGVIVLGEKLRYIFEPFFSSDKIFVVPNGANYSFSSQHNSSPQRHKGAEQPFQLIYLGNLQPSKGILDVIESFLLLLRFQLHASSFQLHIVGKWRDEETKVEVFHTLENAGFQLLASSSTSFQLSSDIYQNQLQVTFHSVLSGAPKLDLLAQCDLMIFPPREPEGHPWVIVEAMAAGLPIIATDQGAITESVIDGENGFIVPTNSPDKIAEKVQLLITDKNLRDKMGKKSRELYLAHFTEDAMVNKLIQTTEKIIQKN